MNEREKSRPADGTAEAGRTETAACGRAAISCNYSITGGAERQERLKISDTLPGERENALKLSELRQLFSEDSRTIRLMIQRERRRVPIVSDCQHGYWIGNVEDVRMFARSMRGRARQIWQTAANVERAAGLRKHVPQLDGQETFFSGGND